MKVNTEHGSHMLFKGAVENAKKNTIAAAREATGGKPIIKKDVGFQPPEKKGTGFDKKA